MNRLNRAAKSLISTNKLLKGINKGFSNIINSRVLIKPESSQALKFVGNQKKLLIKTQKRLFSNKNDKDDNDKPKSENETKDSEEKTTKDNSSMRSKEEIKVNSPIDNESKVAEGEIGNTAKNSKSKKKSTVNLFLEEETNSMNDFVNMEKEDDIEIELNKGNEKTENEKLQDKENLQKFPLIFNLVPIVPHAKLTLSNLHRNDYFFSLIMKYGRLNLVDEDKNYIEDIALFFEKPIF